MRNVFIFIIFVAILFLGFFGFMGLLKAATLVDGAENGGNLFCSSNEVVCGAQNLWNRNDTLDKIWCCSITNVSVDYSQKHLIDSATNGGDLICESNEVVCGAQNLWNRNDTLDKIWCCSTGATVDYGNKQLIDSAANGGDLLCSTNEVVCGAQNLYNRNDTLDKIWCCPTAPLEPPPGNGEPPPGNGEPPPGNGVGPGWITIRNPLEAESFEDLLDSIINFIFYIAIVLAPLMILIGGFYFITAGGDPKRVDTAKRVITYTIIGLVIVLLAKGLVSVIIGILGG